MACLAGLCALLTGCSTAPNDPAVSPYAAEFEQAIAQSKSDYVRQILADGQITTAEIQDARQHMIACLEQAGMSATYETDEYGRQNLTFAEEPSLAEEAAELACDTQWMSSIDSLYNQTTLNPKNEDWDELVAACLVRKGLVPAGFTAQDYKDLVAASSGPRVNSAPLTPNENGVSSVTVAPMPVAVLPGGVPMDSPEVMRCEADPSA